MSSRPDDCRTLTQYLIGRAPSAYVAECYLRMLPSAAIPTSRLIDRALLGAARLGGLPCRMADGYARWFRPTGDLRRRLTLLLAILETAPDTHDTVNDAALGSRGWIIAVLLGTLAMSAIAIGLGVIVFGPIHLVSGGDAPRTASRSSN